eukprot:jgi/Hompol1/5330/HPOL_004344-RA
MVLIPGLLGNWLQDLIQSSNPISDYLLCSALNASNSAGEPYWTSTTTALPATRASIYRNTIGDVIYHTNWMSNTDTIDGSQTPCVFWFGEDYPTNNSVYEPISGVSGNLVRDAHTVIAFYSDLKPLRSCLICTNSSYMAEPVGGWFNYLSTSSDVDSASFFRAFQKRSWAVYGTDPSVSSALLGTRPASDQIDLVTLLSGSSGPAFVSPQNVSNTGILGTLPTRYYLNYSSVVSGSPAVLPVPYFNPVGGNSLDLDNVISKNIEDAVAAIALLDKSSRSSKKNRTVVYGDLAAQIDSILTSVPQAGIYFSKVDHANKKYAFTLQVGNDIRIVSASSYPDSGSRQLYFLTQLTNGLLRNSDVGKLGSASITQGIRYFPQVKNSKENLQIGSLLGGILYPFGVSFLLPIFTLVLVSEKETRILVMMKMNGMKTWSYYLSHYITFYILYAVSVIFFVVPGLAINLSLFTQTSPALLFVLFFLWGHAQIALSLFFSSLFNRTRFALIVVFLIVLSSVIISLAFPNLYPDQQLPVAYFIWPPFAFYRSLDVLNVASYSPLQRPYTLDRLVSGDEVFNIVLMLFGDTCIYIILAFYLNAVFPTEFGVRKPWHFPISDLFKAAGRSSRKRANGGVDPKSEAELALAINVDASETRFEDADVKAERNRIDSNQFDPASPLILKHLRKVFGGRGGAGPKLAVKDATFAVEEGIVFGLLGPNGAGKTTIISMLTGLFGASAGFASIGGFDIKNQTEEVYKRIGICPQFDILWSELTVGEHLYFYARLKGIPAHQERLAVQQALRNVSLEKFEHRQSGGLSGGEKRRLSIAMALLGSPKVVFLDEPTTGLDPEVRRLIWSIIDSSKVGKTVVLTTHSMEEAEALCQRIAIMAKGTLRCIADPSRLKQLYGSGFHIYFNCHASSMQRACEWIEATLPRGWKQIDAFATSATYEFPAVPGALADLFETIEASKADYGLLDWGVSQTTLEDVFVRLISENDADAD